MAGVADPYATAMEYRLAIQKADTGQDGDVLFDLLAVSRYLERRLGRFFNQDAAPITRTFMTGPAGSARVNWAEAENPWRSGGLSRYLSLDADLAALTSITIDLNRDGSFSGDVPLVSADYQLLPLNAPYGPEPRPYRAIELTAWGAQYAFPAATLVQVSGRWGWPAVPDPIKRACIQLTAILRLESPRATRRVDEVGSTIGTSQQANSIVDDLIRHYGVPSL